MLTYLKHGDVFQNNDIIIAGTEKINGKTVEHVLVVGTTAKTKAGEPVTRIAEHALRPRRWTPDPEQPKSIFS